MAKPNILFIFTDDQRFDTIGALGNTEIATPNLDALVARGTAFTNAYIMGGSCGAVCMPSRAMLMTGRSLYRIEEQGQSIPDDHVLLGEALRRGGYDTFGTGKWHNGTRAFARSFSDGGEIFFGGMGDHWNVPACDFDPSGEYTSKIDQTVDFRTQDVRQWTSDHIRAGVHSSELFCDATINFLRERRDGDNPFFAYVSFMAPHDPRTMPRQYLEMYDPARIELPASFVPEHPFDNGELKIRDEMLAPFPRTPEEIREHIAAYYAMITHADAHIGRVLATLEESGLADDTIVVFAGDNGLALGRHGLLGKQSVYDHSVHVPLVMSGPGIPSGQQRDALTYLIDIYPTLCDLTGVAVPDSVEGSTLVPTLSDPNERIRDSLLFAYRHLHRGVRDHRHKLIEYNVDGVRTAQLFDLEDDPQETRDLSADPSHAEDLARLRDQLQLWRRDWGDTQEQGRKFWEGYSYN